MITGVSTERWRNGSLRTRYDLAEAGKRCWYAAGAIADIARINETIAMLNRGAAESAPFRACTSDGRLLSEPSDQLIVLDNDAGLL